VSAGLLLVVVCSVDASKTREAELQNELTAAKQEIEALKKQLRKTQRNKIDF